MKKYLPLLLLPTLFLLGMGDPIYLVQRVVDGDTLVLNTGDKVRLIGVDTPETKHPQKAVEYFGQEASAFTKREIEDQKVYLMFDQSNAYIGHRDKYDRLLAYVYRASDNFFLNAEIIKQGYGFAYTWFPFKYLDEFRKYEREAREKELGLWKANMSYSSAPAAYSQSQEIVYVGSRNSDKYHYPSCVWAKRIKSSNWVTFGSKSEAASRGYIPCKVCEP